MIPPLSRLRSSLNLSLVLFSASSEQAGDDAASAAESLTDADSVKGLGETSDFLNLVREREREMKADEWRR